MRATRPGHELVFPGVRTFLSATSTPAEGRTRMSTLRTFPRPSPVSSFFDSGSERLWAKVRALLVAVLVSLLAGCNLAPKYSRPSVAVPKAFKEAATDTNQGTNIWKIAQPKDAVLRGPWWEAFHDPCLNTLEKQVNISNQNVAAALANYFAARAVVREARAQLFPTVTVNPAVTASQFSSTNIRGQSTPGTTLPSGTTITSSSSSSGGTPITVYSVPFEASWAPDLWGRVRNAIRADAAQAQATAADLENTRLAAQQALAVDYFELRAQDELLELFNATVTAFRQSLELTQVRFRTGIAAQGDVVLAQTQLATAEAQATGLAIQRAQFEHAIALLTGQPASSFSLPPQPLATNLPAIPFGIPSALLERRPDIAAAEKLVAAANAQIGVARAAYYPNLTLTGSAGFQSASLGSLLNFSSGFWSVGGNLAQAVFDAGLRRATVEQFRANYQSAVATYRQTVLTAFQQVEDNLAALRVLSRQIEQQAAAVRFSEQNLSLTLELYKTGIDSYLNVITAQTTLLSNRQTYVSLRLQQFTATVQLVGALGGGWDVSQLPPP